MEVLPKQEDVNMLNESFLLLTSRTVYMQNVNKYRKLYTYQVKSKLFLIIYNAL